MTAVTGHEGSIIHPTFKSVRHHRSKTRQKCTEDDAIQKEDSNGDYEHIWGWPTYDWFVHLWNIVDKREYCQKSDMWESSIWFEWVKLWKYGGKAGGLWDNKRAVSKLVPLLGATKERKEEEESLCYSSVESRVFIPCHQANCAVCKYTTRNEMI
jgi:hypothetical protein